MQTEPIEILFAPDSGPGVGGGHVMRCLSLASALAARGARSTFAVGEDGGAIIERFATAPVATLICGPEALPAVAVSRGWAAAVVDSYRPDAQAEAAFRPHISLLIALDDLANRPHEVDLIVDPSFARDAADYDGLVPAGAARLVGPAYTLLRPEFATLAGLPRTFPDKIDRVFVSFGLSDVGGVTGRTVQRLLQLAPRTKIDVALAGDAVSLPQLRGLSSQDQHVRLHVEARHIAELMCRADVAVGAGGSATWERCALGLPSLAVVVADNQRDLIGQLAKAGILLRADLVAAGFEDELSAAFLRLQDRRLRRQLSEASSGLSDGRGAERVADTILTSLRR